MQHLALMGAALGALGLGWRVVRFFYRAARRIEDTFDLVHRELQPNGGSSLRDAVTRIEGRVERIETRVFPPPAEA